MGKHTSALSLLHVRQSLAKCMINNFSKIVVSLSLRSVYDASKPPQIIVLTHLAIYPTQKAKDSCREGKREKIYHKHFQLKWCLEIQL